MPRFKAVRHDDSHAKNDHNRQSGIVGGICGVVRHDQLEKSARKCFVHDVIANFSSLYVLNEEVTRKNQKRDRLSSVRLCPIAKKDESS
jgi:hypothetical protein